MELRFIPDPLTGLIRSPRADHICGPDGKPLCGCVTPGTPGGSVTWESLHEPRWTPVCPKCRRKAVLLLRPKAEYWYLSPFNGVKHSFGSLAAARKAAKKEHGTPAIWQLGPGETNKIVEFVEGLDPLP